MPASQAAQFPACPRVPGIKGTIFRSCLCRWRTTSTAAAAACVIAPGLLCALRNAGTPQERALIFLRQLRCPYKTVLTINVGLIYSLQHWQTKKEGSSRQFPHGESWGINR